MGSSEQKSPLRHRIILALMCVIVFIGSMQIYSYLTRPPKYRPKYQTVAHRFLDLEGEYLPIPDESYQLLDDVITESKSRVHFDPTITDPAQRQQQLLAIFREIDSILIQNNFIFPPGEWTSTLGEALAGHQLNSRAIEAALAMPHNARRAWQ